MPVAIASLPIRLAAQSSNLEVALTPDGQSIQSDASAAIWLPIAHEQRHFNLAHGNPERSHDVEVALHFNDLIELSEGDLCFFRPALDQEEGVIR